jgi:CYTH domain-containing protein
LPARTLRKKRHIVSAQGWVLAVDEHENGTLIAEIDDGDEPSDELPDWLDIVRDVTTDETWTGGAIAR